MDNKNVGVVTLLRAAVGVVTVNLFELTARLRGHSHSPERKSDLNLYPSAVGQAFRVSEHFVEKLYSVPVVSQQFRIQRFAQLHQHLGDGIVFTLQLGNQWRCLFRF